MALARRLPVAPALLAALLAGPLALAGCGGSSSSTGTTFVPTTTASEQPAGAAGCKDVAQPKPKPDGGQQPPKQKLDPSKTYRVAIQTNCGTFAIEIDQKSAPATGASFVSLARSGFFDRTVFHRIVPGFIIQGGDPTATGTGGPGYTTLDPPKAGAAYSKYVVAMAKTQAEPPGTAGSQFFIVTAADGGLPPDYAILGKVVSGKNVVDRIGKLGDATEQPTRTVEILHTRVDRS